MSKLYLYIIVFLLILIIVPSKNKVDFSFDYAQFRADATSNLLEIYYQFNTKEFIDKSNAGLQTIDFKIIFKVKDKFSGKIIYSDTVSNKYSISDLMKDNGYRDIKGIHKFFLNNGLYDISIFLLSPDETEFLFNSTESISVKPFDLSEPQISGIQLSNSISKSDSAKFSSFTKNTLEVIPNPSASFTSEYPLLQYYTEFYNIGRKNLTLITNLISSQNIILSSSAKDIHSVNESIVNVDQINLLRYPSGIYRLQLILSDSISNYAFASEKQLYFYNKYYTSVNQSRENIYESKSISNLFGFMSSEECDDIFEKSIYIATAIEKESYNQLTTVESKRNFLEQFWQKRNESSGDAEHASYKRYMQRIAEADNKFKGMRKSGYKTERGRVYVTYGIPDRIEPYPNESNLKPYEVWYYDRLEGGVIFIFGDLHGFGEYDLLHSNKRGEIYDDTWQRKLYNY